MKISIYKDNDDWFVVRDEQGKYITGDFNKDKAVTRARNIMFGQLELVEEIELVKGKYMLCRECKNKYTETSAKSFPEWYCSRDCEIKGIERLNRNVDDQIIKERGDHGGVKTCVWGKYYGNY